jgi:hypothetical protein
MDERRSIFYRPRRQAFLLILIVIVAYLLLLGPQGEARDVLTGEGYAFVSFGEHGGIDGYSACWIQWNLLRSVFMIALVRLERLQG